MCPVVSNALSAILCKIFACERTLERHLSLEEILYRNRGLLWASICRFAFTDQMLDSHNPVKHSKITKKDLLYYGTRYSADSIRTRFGVDILASLPHDSTLVYGAFIHHKVLKIHIFRAVGSPRTWIVINQSNDILIPFSPAHVENWFILFPFLCFFLSFPLFCSLLCIDSFLCITPPYHITPQTF